MSTLGRFRGTVMAGLVLAGVAATTMLIDATWGPPEQLEEMVLPRIFRFEKEDLVGVRVVRPDGDIHIVRDGSGRWQFIDKDWRPNRSMLRRVAHQLHDLSARAEVVREPSEPELYGLGEGAIVVHMTLRAGTEIAFEVGDPNPTSVSWYMRTLPDGPVFVVKKAALAYYRSPVEDFREDRFAFFSAADCVAIEATVDGRRLVVTRTGEKTWEMTEPVTQEASREAVRMMMGRVSALRAQDFVEDHPADLAKYGLGDTADTIVMRLATGERVSLRLGQLISGTEPPQRYVFRLEDEAVYAAREGLIEAYRYPEQHYRNRILVGRHEWDVAAMTVWLGDASVVVTRTADDWRWPDTSVVPGSTPKRVAERAADVRAIDFPSVGSDDDARALTWGGVSLTFVDGSTAALSLGAPWEAPASEEGGGPEERQVLRLGGGPERYVIGGGLSAVIEDIHREHARKLDRDAERTLRLAEEP